MDLVATVRSFLRVAETSSFSAVAAERGVTQPAVSRQVSALEELLRMQLVHRTTHAVTLTDEGKRLALSAREMIDAVDAFLQESSSHRDKASGRVRLGVPVGMGTYIGRHLPRLLETHDALMLDIVLREQPGHLVKNGLDIEVCYGGNEEPSTVRRRIGALSVHVVASPSYLEGKKRPLKPADLADHQCLVLHNYPTWWFGTSGADEVGVRVSGRITSNESFVLHQAALAGQGITVLAAHRVREDLASGRLVALMPDVRCRSFPIYLAYPSRRRIPLRTRVVMEHLTKLIQNDPEMRE